eukprot:1689011-Rhodomonas_salina.2
MLIPAARSRREGTGWGVADGGHDAAAMYRSAASINGFVASVYGCVASGCRCVASVYGGTAWGVWDVRC